MGSRGDGGNRPVCVEEGCGRRAYVEGEAGALCHVCDSALRNDWATKLLSGSPAGQRSTPLQNFLRNPPLAKLCMEFAHGDGWELQCHCTRCSRPWLNTGWVCPVEYHRHAYLQHLDSIYRVEGYARYELSYVDWTAAVAVFHDMSTGEIPFDIVALLRFARLSAEQVHHFLREVVPDDGRQLGDFFGALSLD